MRRKVQTATTGSEPKADSMIYEQPFIFDFFLFFLPKCVFSRVCSFLGLGVCRMENCKVHPGRTIDVSAFCQFQSMTNIVFLVLFSS